MPDGSLDEDFSLQDLRGRYFILLRYPLNCTFV
jgi:hypothetical protein